MLDALQFRPLEIHLVAPGAKPLLFFPMMALLEPLMILVMGSVVGFIVLAILLPIFQASQGIG